MFIGSKTENLFEEGAFSCCNSFQAASKLRIGIFHLRQEK
jgi:hypothetical protein